MSARKPRTLSAGISDTVPMRQGASATSIEQARVIGGVARR